MSTCVKCSLEKTGAGGRCKPCFAAYMRAWNHLPGNMTKIVARGREYNKTHVVAVRGYKAAWKKRNPEKVRAQYNRRAHEVPSKIAAKGRAYRERHPEYKERQNEKRRIERIENPEKARARERAEYHCGSRKARVINYHIRKKGCVGSHTESEWLAVCKRQKYKCAVCGLKTKLTRDHIIPVRHGGSNYICNIQALCQSCNSRKRATIASGTQHTLFDRTAA